MKKCLILIAAILLYSPIALAQPTEKEILEGTAINNEKIEALKNNGAEVIDQVGITQVSDRKTHTIYYFTKPDHPAHPFYFKVEFYEASGMVNSRISGEGYGDKKETDRMYKELQNTIKTSN